MGQSSLTTIDYNLSFERDHNDQRVVLRVYEAACKAMAKDRSMVLHHEYFDAPIREESLTDSEIRDSIVHLLSGPSAKDDAEFVEAAFGLIRRVGRPDNWLEVVSKLLLETSHKQHEEIIGLMQEYRNPSSIPFLKKAILLKPELEYLEYDDYGAYYKKCLWALQDIGTDEAIAVIRECASSEDAALKEQAEYRLKKTMPRN